MNTANLLTSSVAALAWDPVNMVSQMGYAARLIVGSLFAMACWVCWLAVAKRDAQRVRSRVRYLRAIGQTAPLIGFLGTAVGAMNALIGVTRQASPDWHRLGAGMAESLVTAAIGILVGVAAYWTAALLNGDHVHQE